MHASAPPPADLFAGPGIMRSMLRALDWSRSPLGAPHTWPPALRMATGLMLDSKFPMFLAWGPQLGFLYNDGYIDILGRKHPDAAGQAFRAIWGEIWDDISPLVDRALAGEATFAQDMPLSMLRKGHEEQTWFTFSYSPLRDEHGVVAGMFCACTETTKQILADRRQAFQLALADALRGVAEPEHVMAVASRALGQHIGAARVGYGEIDALADTVHVSRDWHQRLPSLAGETRSLASFGPAIIDELRAGKVLVLNDVGSDPRSMPFAAGYASIGVSALLVAPLIRGGVLTAVLYLHENLPRRWTDEEIALVVDVAGRTWASVEHARAEERRRRAESALSAQLQNERNRLRTLFQQAPGFMAVLRGPQHVFEMANEAYLRLIGPRELIGKPVREALPEIEGQPFFALLDTVYNEGKPYFANEARVMLQRSPGRSQVERYVDFIYQPLTEPDGSVSGIFVEGYDVTERVQAYHALRDADRRKDEFLAMLAHELRNPLAPISAAALLLKEAAHDEARVRRASDVITRQVEHMTGLVDDLLDVSRVTRGLVKLDFEALDLADVVAAAIEQVRTLIEAKRQILTVHHPASRAYVSGDRLRLVQVVGNLLNNAAKYTPEGGSIVITLTTSDEQVTLEVADSGIGIAPELLPHVFEPFTQAERSPDRSLGGLGLGLALVKNLLALHGGSIAAESAGVAQGSRFSLCLPRLHPARNPGVPAVLSPDYDSDEDRNPVRVMVVDDNEDAAQSLALLLEAFGHRVTVALRARHALECARRDPPDVFLLDIGLPDMDGYELARQLRSETATARATLIALTGYGQPQDQARSHAAGFDHHLVKPADTHRLLRLIEQTVKEQA